MPVLRILYGIRKQVGDNLADSLLISIKGFRNILMIFNMKFQSLFFCPKVNHIVAAAYHRHYIIFIADNFHVPRLNFGKIQNVINQGKKCASRFFNICSVLFNFLKIIGTLNHFIHSENRINGASDLMGHICKKSLLIAVCTFQLFLILFELALFFLIYIFLYGNRSTHRNGHNNHTAADTDVGLPRL